MRPRARTRDLVVRKLGDETVVYDRRDHQAHCLNLPAALVFERCDGERGPRDLAEAVGRELGATVNEAWIRLAVDGLVSAGLVEDGPDEAAPPRPGARRRLLRQAGQAALLPVVLSLLAPTPAEAAASACIPEATCPGGDGTPCYRNVGLKDIECQDCTCSGVGTCQGPSCP